jgi:hypothetical protein
MNVDGVSCLKAVADSDHAGSGPDKLLSHSVLVQGRARSTVGIVVLLQSTMTWRAQVVRQHGRFRGDADCLPSPLLDRGDHCHGMVMFFVLYCMFVHSGCLCVRA